MQNIEYTRIPIFRTTLGQVNLFQLFWTAKQSIFFRIQVRASSQTNGLGEADGRVRVVRFARVRLLRYTKPILRNKPTFLQSRIILVKAWKILGKITMFSWWRGLGLVWIVGNFDKPTGQEIEILVCATSKTLLGQFRLGISDGICGT